MLKSDVERALELSRRCIEEYWQGNADFVIEHLHPQVFWIGSMDNEYLHGAEKIKERFYLNKAQSPQVYLDEEEFRVVAREGNQCVVVGRWRAYTLPESGYVLSEKQRVTFVWVKAQQLLQIMHIHLSNTLHIQDEGEYFPIKAGKESYAYLKKLLHAADEEQSLIKKDIDGVMRVIKFKELLYLLADANYVELKTVNGQFRIRSTMGALEKLLPKFFYKLRRGVIINKNFVQQEIDGLVVLEDGAGFRVSEKRLADFHKFMGGVGYARYDEK